MHGIRASPMRERVVDFRRSTRVNKKYAVLVRGPAGMRTVHFGDNRYAQFRDSTPLRLYAAYDHGDRARRENFVRRHGGGARSKRMALRFEERRSGGRITPRFLSIKYLW